MVGAGETCGLNGLLGDVDLLVERGRRTVETAFDGEFLGTVGTGTESLAVLALSDVYRAGVRLTIGVNLNVSVAVVELGASRAMNLWSVLVGENRRILNDDVGKSSRDGESV